MKSLQINVISRHKIQTETYQENHLIICEFLDTYHGIATTYADFFLFFAFYMGIKFRGDFYTWVFNLAIFLQSRKKKNLTSTKLSTSKVAL